MDHLADRSPDNPHPTLQRLSDKALTPSYSSSRLLFENWLGHACILVAGCRRRKQCRLIRVTGQSQLLEVGKFRLARYRRNNSAIITDDFDEAGLDGFDHVAMNYVALHDGHIVAAFRGVAGAPISQMYFGAARVAALVGDPSTHVELGRLAVSPESEARRLAKALIMFAVLDMLLTVKHARYIGYYKPRNGKVLKYLNKSKLHDVTFTKGDEAIPYVLFHGNGKTAFAQLLSLGAALLRFRVPQ